MTCVDINLTITIELTCQLFLDEEHHPQMNERTTYSNNRYMPFKEDFTRITRHCSVIRMQGRCSTDFTLMSRNFRFRMHIRWTWLIVIEIFVLLGFIHIEMN